LVGNFADKILAETNFRGLSAGKIRKRRFDEKGGHIFAHCYFLFGVSIYQRATIPVCSWFQYL
jgi:hypothetical protein